MDLTRTIEIVFGARSDVARVTRAIESDIGRLESGVQDITQPLASATNAILAIDAAIVALGGTAVAFAVNEAIQFESALLDLQRVLSDGESASDFSGQIDEIALRFGVSSTAVTQSLADFRQAGFDTQAALELVEGSLVAVNISELSVNESTALLTQTIRGFQFDASETTRILDVLNSTSNNFGANTREIGTALSDLAPIANLAGLSLEEAAGFLTPVIENLGSGTEAATGFRTILLRLTSDTRPVQEGLQALGVSQTNANGSLRSGRDILFDVARAFQNVNQEQQLSLARQLAGINQADVFSLSLSNFNRVLEVTETVSSDAGNAQRELEIRLASTEVAINRVGVAFNQTAVSIGNQFLPETRGIADAATELLSAFRQVVDDGGLQPLFDGLRPLFAEFESNLQTIAQNLPEAFEGVDFDGLVDSIRGLSDEFGDLFGEIDLSTPEGLTQAIQRVIDTGESLVRLTSGIVSSLEPLFNALLSGTDGFNGINDSVQQTIGSFLGFASQVNTLLPILASLLGVAGGVATVLGGLSLARTVATFGALNSSLTSTVTLLGRAGLAGGVAGLVLAIGELTGANDVVVESIQDFIGNLNGTTDEIERNEAAAQRSIDTYNRQRQAFEEVARASRELLNETIASRSAEFNRTEITNALTEAFRQQGLQYDAVTGQVVNVNEAVRDATDSSSNWVRTLEDGVPTFTQISAAAESTFGQAEEAANDATRASENFLLEIERIRSNERVAVIEAMFNLNVAQLEAQTQQVEAAFESINTTVDSTGSVISSLFSDLEGATGLNQTAIERQIEAENERRDEVLRDQRRLNDSIIRLNNERANALRDGGTTITFQAEGLEPDLELLLITILERIQVSVIEQQSEFLLGTAS